MLTETGWTFIPEQDLPSKGKMRKVPDYCLFLNDETRQRAAKETETADVFREAATVLEAKRVQHSLDEISDSETPGWFPSQQVQDYLRNAKDKTGQRYGKKQIINDVSLKVEQGQIVALIGHNGAGKSTLLKAIFGMIPIWQGRVLLDGVVKPKPTPREMLHSGVAYVPQGNRVFTDLTVQENLEMGGITLSKKELLKEGIERVFTLFPALKPRLKQRAGTLSGGEKQMLALANALILSPKLLLLDEPSLGLAPPLVSEALGRIQQINRDSGVTVLIVEQKVREVLKIAHRVYVLRTGRVSFTGRAEELKDDAKLREVYL
ncbi:MAG: ABC transporter ATP-binding protein [Verrucomicrobiota bacterium]